jgi:hypothetical protein
MDVQTRSAQKLVKADSSTPAATDVRAARDGCAFDAPALLL